MAGREDYRKINKKITEAKAVKPALARVGMIREILSWLGNPDKRLRIIHIAGTNGKGSTGTMLKSVLCESKYHVGHFSAPAIQDDLMMITIDGQPIDQKDVVKIVHEITFQIKKHDGDFSLLSTFEWWVLIALVYFAQQDTQFVILEEGPGGSNDVTNAVRSPYLIAYTKISLDNVCLTGSTLQQVATEYAKIIKAGSLVVSYPGQDYDVQKILHEKSQAVGAFWNPYPLPKITILSSAPRGLSLKIDDIPNIHLPLAGAYQASNLSTVLQIVTFLQQKGFQLSTDRTMAALSNVSITGRMEYVADRNILYDGASNLDGISGLRDSIKAWHLPFKPVFVLGLLDDRNAHEIIDIVASVASTIIAVTPEARDGMTAEAMASYCLHNTNIDVEIADDPGAAVQLARKYRDSSDALIVVTGSIYTLRAIFNEEEG
ncbi:tetrahydrofolate synthase [Weissella coleopterorum]|uniref:Tetrahydrofolate synthase n=1 Tax=Weissella coleopterorum TaxID=2714949 RepID=A0A6G8B017_9LACO|nr:tetrahydrofolate synthase [Weissella coleopterorum]QIL50654.1 tetrahydrofolate synthase [Weissella coleopterorum]